MAFLDAFARIAMFAFARRSLSRLHVRVAILLAAGIMVAGIGFETLLVTLVRRGLEQELEARSRSTLVMEAREAFSALAHRDRAELADQLARIASESDVAGIAAYRSDGHLAAMNVLDPDAWNAVGAALPREAPLAGDHPPSTLERRVQRGRLRLLDLLAPVDSHVPALAAQAEPAKALVGPPTPQRSERVGWIRLVVSTGRVERAVGNTARLGMIVLLIALLLGAFLVSVIVRMLVRPLREAAALASEIADGHLERRLPVNDEDELGTLARSMNCMAEGLEQARQIARSEAATLRRATDATVAIARGAHDVQDVRGVFALVAAQAQTIAQCDAVALAVPGSGEQDLALTDFEPPEPWRVALHGSRITREDLSLWIVPGQGSARLSLDTPREALTRRLHEEGFRSALVVPLTVAGTPAGVLLLMAFDPDAFPDAESDVIAALASHLAAALQAAQLHERLEHAIVELDRTRDSLVRSESLRLAGEMATGVAHEFNNVLGAILGRAQLLRQEAAAGRLAPEKLESSLLMIERAAQDGGETVRRLRQFGRGSQSRETTTFEIEDAISDALEFTRPRWENESQAAGRPVILALDVARGCWVSGRGNELREVFTNLILNAVDALPRGGVLRINARAVAGKVIAIVQDDGLGMADEARARLFEPFFTTKGDSGAGLGLSVVYGIVQRHGGSISVESRPGRGARFEISLPLAPGSAAGPETTPVLQAPLDANLPCLNVIVVDDEPAVRELLRDITAALGHHVEAYDSGVAAFKHYRPGQIDLLLTDLGMPGVSGWKLASNIRAVDPEVAIAFVTGWGEDMNADEVHEAGADLVISKPFTVEDVIAVLKFAADRRDRPQLAA